MGIEPTYSGFTDQRPTNGPQSPWKTPRQDSNLCKPALQTSALPLDHAVEPNQHTVKGSNLPTPDLEAGVPPLGLTVRCDA